jgi:hypothetical protein
MGYLEAHYAHDLIYHCRGSTAGGADVARAVVERVFRPLQKLSANPYFYHTSFPPLFPLSGLRSRHARAVLRARE